jgi:hypothetical protein
VCVCVWRLAAGGWGFDGLFDRRELPAAFVTLTYLILFIEYFSPASLNFTKDENILDSCTINPRRDARSLKSIRRLREQRFLPRFAACALKAKSRAVQGGPCTNQTRRVPFLRPGPIREA